MRIQYLYCARLPPGIGYFVTLHKSCIVKYNKNTSNVKFSPRLRACFSTEQNYLMKKNPRPKSLANFPSEHSFHHCVHLSRVSGLFLLQEKVAPPPAPTCMMKYVQYILHKTVYWKQHRIRKLWGLIHKTISGEPFK